MESVILELLLSLVERNIGLLAYYLGMRVGKPEAAKFASLPRVDAQTDSRLNIARSADASFHTVATSR